MSSVLEAVRSGDAKQLKKLLKAGGDANELGDGNTTPLIEAAAAGHTALVQLLLDAGAEPSLTDASKETALLKAAANGHRDVIELLMPLATDDERGLAEAFLAANDHPELSPLRDAPAKDSFAWKAARAAASVATALGHEEPQRRIERQEQAERAEKKKR